MKDVLVFGHACAIFVPPLFCAARGAGNKKRDKRTNGIFMGYLIDIN
jgi:hypothetical protein